MSSSSSSGSSGVAPDNPWNTSDEDDSEMEMILGLLLDSSSDDDDALAAAMEAWGDAITQADAAGACRKERVILAHRYPGDVLECMSLVVPPINDPDFPLDKMWINQPELENSQYFSLFRMNRAPFDHLVDIVSPCIDRADGMTPIIPCHKVYTHRDIVALTLYHLGHASPFKQMQAIFGRPAPTIRLMVRLGVSAIEQALIDGDHGHRQINFPTTANDRAAVIAGFRTFIHGMPQCCGAIDGTLIGMKKPSRTQVSPRLTRPELS